MNLGSFWRLPRLQRQGLIVALFALTVGLANLTKPLHIDDTLYVTIARQIVHHPSDPYSVPINWQHRTEPAYKVSISPPFLSYWLSLAYCIPILERVEGQSNWSVEEWRDVLLHAMMIPWLFLLAWSSFQLAKRFGVEPTFASIGLIGSAAVQAGLNLMLDIPMLAASFASMEFLERALFQDSNINASETKSIKYPGPRLIYLGLATLCAALAVAIKYPAIALVPAWLIRALWNRTWRPLLPLLAMILTVLGWQIWSRQLYGSSQVQQSLDFLAVFHFNFLRMILERSLTGLAGVAATVPFWLPWLLQWFISGYRLLFRPFVMRSRMDHWHTGRLIVGLLFASLMTGIASWLANLPRPPQTSAMAAGFLPMVFLGSAGFLDVLGSTIQRFFSNRATATVAVTNPIHARNYSGLVLQCAVWVSMTLIFVFLFSPFMALRNLLVPQYFLLLLTWGRLHNDFTTGWVRSWGISAFLVGLVFIGSVVAYTDSRWARVYPAVATASKNIYPQQPIYFLGHWGWQDYAQRQGFISWEADWMWLPTTGVVVEPLRVDKQFLHPQVRTHRQPLTIWTVPAAPLGWTTWNLGAGIRLHGGDYGHLPWGWSNAPTEQITIWSLPGMVSASESKHIERPER